MSQFLNSPWSIDTNRWVMLHSGTTGGWDMTWQVYRTCSGPNRKVQESNCAERAICSGLCIMVAKFKVNGCTANHLKSVRQLWQFTNWPIHKFSEVTKITTIICAWFCFRLEAVEHNYSKLGPRKGNFTEKTFINHTDQVQFMKERKICFQISHIYMISNVLFGIISFFYCFPMGVQVVWPSQSSIDYPIFSDKFTRP